MAYKTMAGRSKSAMRIIIWLQLSQSPRIRRSQSGLKQLRIFFNHLWIRVLPDFCHFIYPSLISRLEIIQLTWKKTRKSCLAYLAQVIRLSIKRHKSNWESKSSVWRKQPEKALPQRRWIKPWSLICSNKLSAWVWATLDHWSGLPLVHGNEPWSEWETAKKVSLKSSPRNGIGVDIDCQQNGYPTNRCAKGQNR